MRQEFDVPGRLPGLNDYIAACRSYAAAGGKVKKKAQEKVCAAIEAAGLKPMEAPVSLRIDWHEKDKRRDKDNIRFGVKFIQDALVETGIFQNDNWKWIAGISDTYQVNRENPHVHVTLEEVHQ